MNGSTKCYRRKGSVIIGTIAVFVVLVIVLFTFLRSTTSKKYTTKKLGDNMLAKELANSLAVVAFHYIKNIELKGLGSGDLLRVLSEPMPFKKTSDEKGDLIAGIKGNVKEDKIDIITVLLEKSGLTDIKLDELSWQIKKDRFEKLKLGDDDSPFPREKKGTIGVFVKVSYKLPGQKSPISENYTFESKINVVANLLPVLSKFTLYVEDMFGNSQPSNMDELQSRFNIVSATAGGKLNNDAKACPWVLNNGSSSNYYDSYKDFVENKKGLVYLGGGTSDKPVVLGIARGFADMDQGNYGEDFHFYKRGTGGYWKSYEVWGEGEGIIAADIGLCDDLKPTDNLKKWQQMFGEAQKKTLKKSSIFRLFGTDKSKSPTLVLGYVDSMFARAKAYKGPSGNNKLVYFDHADDFIAFSGLDPNDLGENTGAALQYSLNISISKFATAYSAKTGLDNSVRDNLYEFYKTYKKEYASRIMRNRYNKDYTYILAREKGADEDACAYPVEYGNDLVKGDLQKICVLSEDEVFLDVPSTNNAKYGNIYKDTTNSLEKLRVFLNKNKLCIDGSSDSEFCDRIAHTFKVDKAGEDLEGYLKFLGLLQEPKTKNIGMAENGISAMDPKLDLNGWLFVDCDTEKNIAIEFKQCSTVSQGGVIVANKGSGKANVKIKGNIHGKHLTFIALNGDIEITNNVNQIDASLITNGQIILEAPSNIDKSHDLIITGNVVMKYIKKDSLENGFRRKLYLKYNEDLAAIPYMSNYNLSDEQLLRTEYPMLMYDLKDDVKKID